MTERTPLTTYRNSDLRVVYQFPQDTDLTDMVPSFFYRLESGATPLLTVTTAPTSNGSSAVIIGTAVVVTLKIADLAVFPAVDVWAGVYDSVLTKNGFVNKFVGGPLTQYVDGSYGDELFGDTVIVSLNEVELPIIIEGGNLGAAAGIGLAALNAAVTAAEAAAVTAAAAAQVAVDAAASVPAMLNGKLNVNGDNASPGILVNLGTYSAGQIEAVATAAANTATNALGVSLATNTGAASIGSSTGLTVEARLTALENAAYYEYARANPPGAISGQDYYNTWPDVTDTVQAIRMTEFLFMVRTLRPSGYIEEMVYRNPNGYAGVNDGWQLWAHRVFAGGKVKNNLLQPSDLSLATTTEFAFRLGLTTDTYPTDYPPSEVNGFGHGNMIVPPGGVNIKLNAVGDNLVGLDKWPVGTIIKGASLNILTYCRLLLHSGATEAANIDFNLIIDGDYNVREIGQISALISNLAFQDSPTSMHATNFADPNGYNTAKLSGQAAVPLVGSNTQKGNWRAPITAGTAQFYHTDDDTIVYTLRSAKGPAIQNQAETLTPYQYCPVFRGHVVDQTDVAKFALYASSSEEVGPFTTTPLPMADPHIFYNFRSTEYMPGGPA